MSENGEAVLPKAKRKKKAYGRIIVLCQAEPDGEWGMSGVQPQVPITSMDAMRKWCGENLNNANGEYGFARVMRENLTVTLPTKAEMKFK